MNIALAIRTPIYLQPDPSRVLLHLFIAGLEDFSSVHSRAKLVIERSLLISDDEVDEALHALLTRFLPRHADIRYWFDLHFIRISNLIPPSVNLSEARRLLIGALFTHEFSTEGASLTNPSMVLGESTSSGISPFVMSVRGIGEGHRSSIGFRTGTVSANGRINLDLPEAGLKLGMLHETLLSKHSFMDLLEAPNILSDNATLILNNLGENFTNSELEIQVNRLLNDRETFRNADLAATHFRSIAERSYAVSFPPECAMSEQILWPHASCEWRGMEDLRLVRFVEDDDSVVYFGSYTAFDGSAISQQMLQTSDFKSFKIFPVSGSPARSKGLALFPRRINGKFAALSRCDGETNSICFSETPDRWDCNLELESPHHWRELIQVGNCGSPIETDQGWLVLTHSVGPMRTYTIGAILLDIDDPTQVIGKLIEPLIQPEIDALGGYVPNVVYSCGGVVHHENLVIPFGINDQSIGIATIKVDDVLTRMKRNDKDVPY